MLAASPVRSFNDETESQKQEKEEAYVADFSPGNWIDTIDFDDLLAGISNDELKDCQIELRNFADETVELKEMSPEMRKATMAEETTSVSQETVTKSSPCCKGARKSRKNTTATSGKKKVKVDWTPDLHRRFVKAVEQLGIDKAVPSRILELMEIDCLTRHNVASHLQKYRSHRKHLLARESEAASCNQRRHIYAAGPSPMNKESSVNNPWITPTIGIPTMPNFRPLNHLNVWGHPFVDQSSYMAMFPKPFCLPYHHVMLPFYPPAVMPISGIPPMPMTGLGVHQVPRLPQSPSADSHPSKESVDAAIREVLSKPWMPLPLGLTPPSIDSVLMELQAQGISKIPPVRPLQQ